MFGAKDALRKASENQQLFAPRGNVSETIIEENDEEDEEDSGDENEDKPQQPQVVPISPFSEYDPRVFSAVDPPMAVFRIKLVCTIFETAHTHVVTMANEAKLEHALASLQRYLFTKTQLPSDVEFSVLDLFDALDSELKNEMGDRHGRRRVNKATSHMRYNTWLEAHQVVVAAEKNKIFDDAKVKVRLLAQAGLLGADDADGDLLDEDDNTAELSEEEESVDGLSDDENSVGGEPTPDVIPEVEMADDNESDSGSSSDDEEDSSEEEEGEGDEIDEAAVEEAYMRKLEDEAFESELRKLTMEALEKGKVIARSAGGKVSDQMIAAPQFMSKKPAVVEGEDSDGEERMQFKLFKRGNKGKQEEVQLFVPKDTNLARRATKNDDAAAKERDMLKARALEYAAASADAGGNVYLEETKIQTNRNKKLTMDTLDKNFGKNSTSEAPYRVSGTRGRGPGRSSVVGRGPGRGRGGRGAGRLFNPGRSSS